MWPVVGFKPQSRPLHVNGGGKPFRVDFSGQWRIDAISRMAGEGFKVTGFLARISVEVFMSGKLCWIDKNRDNNPIGFLANLVNQR